MAQPFEPNRFHRNPVAFLPIFTARARTNIYIRIVREIRSWDASECFVKETDRNIEQVRMLRARIIIQVERRVCLSIVKDLDASYRSDVSFVLSFARVCSFVRSYGRSVGRFHAGSFVTRSTYSGQRPTPQALPASLSLSLFFLGLSLSLILSVSFSLHPVSHLLLSCPSNVLAHTRALLLSPYLSTTRHCVPPRRNSVYSLTLWIFRKRFAGT